MTRQETALITGAGRGIGEAIAKMFAKAGKNLVLVARTCTEIECVAAEAQTLGVEALPLTADVSCLDKVKHLVCQALERFRWLDVLVNCAGIYGPIGPLVENDMAAWARTIQINVLGTAFCMHAVLPHMIARRSGVIINFSGGGAVAPFPRFSAYSSSKAAVVRLTETAAAELKEFNISVNAIAPGAVNTRMLDEVLQAGERAGPEFYAKAKVQKERGGTPPTKAAELALFLTSPGGRSITGRLISAVWDDWPSIPEQLRDRPDSSMFTLRRIDGQHFTEVR